MDIADKVAVVTGAGSGIGAATGLRLAAEGARVVLVDADTAGGERTLHAVRGAGHAHSGEAIFIRADVTQEGEIAAVFLLAEERFGGIDIVHNNAGLISGWPRFPELPAERWRHVLDVNLGGVILGCQLALPYLRKRGGVIVNTASLAAFSAMPSDPVYAASKAGVMQFTRSLAWLQPEYGVRVCCVCPGVVDTPLVRNATDPVVAGAVDRITPLTPDEIADAVAFLIHDDDNAGKALRVTRAGEREYAGRS